MTDPVTPTTIPPLPASAPAQQEAETAAKVANALVRTRKYLSNTLKVTVPAAATGALTALIVSRRNRDEDDDVVFDDTSD